TSSAGLSASSRYCVGEEDRTAADKVADERLRAEPSARVRSGRRLVQEDEVRRDETKKGPSALARRGRSSEPRLNPERGAAMGGDGEAMSVLGLGTGAIQCPNPHKSPHMCHLLRVANAQEPLTSADVRDLAAALDVPQAWLHHGWDSPDAV